jgi:hypothetical protein
MTTTPVNAYVPTRRLVGNTTTEKLVHSLAISLVDPNTIREVPIVNGPNSGKVGIFGTIAKENLVAVVGDALAASTLKALINRHPALSDAGSPFYLSVRLGFLNR